MKVLLNNDASFIGIKSRCHPGRSGRTFIEAKIIVLKEVWVFVISTVGRNLHLPTKALIALKKISPFGRNDKTSKIVKQ